MESNYNNFCKTKECPYYLEWDCYGKRISCRLVGESSNITEYPNSCLHLEEILTVKIAL